MNILPMKTQQAASSFELLLMMLACTRLNRLPRTVSTLVKDASGRAKKRFNCPEIGGG